MSLILLICNCHNSETVGRKVLNNAGVTDYMGVPVRKGRVAIRQWLDSTQDDALEEVRSLKAYIANHSSYTIVAGYDDGRFKWADAKGSLDNQIKAESIAQIFA